MNKTFKAGDKVYFPGVTDKVLTLSKNARDSKYYPLTADGYTFTFDGNLVKDNRLPSIFHATPKNHALLEQLYGGEFEKPPVKPSSKEIIRAMLDRGDLCVPCWASDSDENPDYTNACVLINLVSDGGFIDSYGIERKYATPFNPITGQPITELSE